MVNTTVNIIWLIISILTSNKNSLKCIFIIAKRLRSPLPPPFPEGYLLEWCNLYSLFVGFFLWNINYCRCSFKHLYSVLYWGIRYLMYALHYVFTKVYKVTKCIDVYNIKMILKNLTLTNVIQCCHLLIFL